MTSCPIKKVSRFLKHDFWEKLFVFFFNLDQWSPNNLDGKKIYDKEFLLALRDNPNSKKKPPHLPDYIASDDRGVSLFIFIVILLICLFLNRD